MTSRPLPLQSDAERVHIPELDVWKLHLDPQKILEEHPTAAEATRPQPNQPDSAPRITCKPINGVARIIPRRSVSPQVSLYDHENSHHDQLQARDTLESAFVKSKEEEVFQLLSARNVFWQQITARRLSQPENKTRRFLGLHFGGSEQLNQIFGIARITAEEKLFLQSVIGEGMVSMARTAESSPTEFPLDPNDSIGSSPASEDIDTTSYLWTPYFDDAFLIPAIADSEDDERL